MLCKLQGPCWFDRCWNECHTWLVEAERKMKKPKRYEFFCVLDYSEVQKLAAKSWKFLHRSWDIGIQMDPRWAWWSGGLCCPRLQHVPRRSWRTNDEAAELVQSLQAPTRGEHIDLSPWKDGYPGRIAVPRISTPWNGSNEINLKTRTEKVST